MRIPSSLLVTLFCSTLASSLQAGNWPNWRGPNFNGTAAADEKNLPTKFSPTEGVSWAADLPGPAASTPVIWNDTVFVSSAVEADQKVYAHAIDRKTGKELWKFAVASSFRADDRSNFANPSPVTDGKQVIFFFGTGDLVAYDFAGKELWKRNLEKDHGRFAIQWTYGSSPLLYEGNLYIQVLQRNEAFVFGSKQKGEPDGKNDSYLLSIDPKTGKDQWKVIRPAEAQAESLESFTTPFPYTHNNRSEIVLSGGDCISGCDPKTGKELWRWGTWNPTKISHWRLVTSPVGGDGVLLACAPKGAPIYAVKAGGSGALKDTDLAWTSEDDQKNVSSDVATPAFYQGHFYVVNTDRKTISCVEAKTGKVIWSEEIPSPDVRLQKLEASPTIADGKLYVVDHRGTVVVVEASTTFKLLAINPMGNDKEQNVRSTIAVASGQLFIRCNGKLYCVGK
jgi:outer membrane protein assembly factor BamB